ncbi:hypothetical protein A1F94_008370 [Pyrenophora tritici-repentis]|nr:hypothetical protein A1F94_008370 [Pyrenophora tritici-repentis]
MAQLSTSKSSLNQVSIDKGSDHPMGRVLVHGYPYEEIRMFEDQDMQNLWHRSRQEDELYQELTTLVANKERNLPTKLQKEKSFCDTFLHLKIYLSAFPLFFFL